MIKFVKGHLEKVTHVEIYPLISLLIFVIFFVLLFFWVFSRKKQYTEEMKHMPLHDDGIKANEEFNHQ